MSRFSWKKGDIETKPNKFVWQEGDLQPQENRFVWKAGDLQPQENRFIWKAGDLQPITNAALSLEDSGLEIQIDNDFGELKTIVVGRLDNDVLPVWYPNFDGKDGNEVLGPPGTTKQNFNAKMYEKAIKQTDKLCKLLEKEDVKVIRPDLLESGQESPVGLTAEWPREAFSVFGKRIVAHQTRTPHRNKDWIALEKLFVGKEVLRVPACDYERRDNDLVNDPRPFLEGGDIFRLNDFVIVTMSYMASSPTGYRWLSDTLCCDVWPAYLTEDWEHGDYVFMPIREGLCVAYLDAFVDKLLPTPITDWDVIALTKEEANEKFAANGIILRENVVLLPKGNDRVVKALEKKGVDTIEVPFDGPMYWQGGIDCATNELLRK
jgi:N-dimethylarginine dimethylaminohydrolase